MTSSAPNTGGIFPGAGPWLVRHGRGVRSEDVAGEAVDQCRARAVEVIPGPIDVHDDIDLAYILGLVLVLPDEPPRGAPLRAELTPYRELIQRYRARRPWPAREALLQRRKWYEIGVVQLAGFNALLGAAPLRGVKDDCCVRHQLDGDSKLDFFSVYTRPALPLRSTTTEPARLDTANELYLEAVYRLQRWSIDPADTVGVLATIDRYRRIIEDQPRQATRHRPIAGVAMNRLDLILDDRPPHLQTDDAWRTAVGENHKAWQEADAKVWRDVYNAILENYPGVHYPNSGRTGAVQRLRDLYSDLRIVAPFHQ